MFFFSSRRRHTRLQGDWSSDVCSSDLGALLGLPMLPDGDVWVDIAGAAVVANRAQGTITSYLSRRTPKRNPFPQAHRHLYRLYWPLSQIRRWRADQDAAEAEDA